MTAEQIRERVIEIVAEQMALYRDRVSLADTRQSLGMDSLDDVEVLMVVEDEFDLTIADETAQQWTTLGDLVTWLAANVKA